MAKEETQGITVKKSSDISEWYTQVIQKAELAEYTDVSGCIIYRPRSYAIWEKIVEFFDKEIKKLGVQNSYFPLLIPEKLLKKEAAHVAGFAPEVAWVTQGGDTVLSERLAVRPTSETIMYDAYSKWVRSYRDLPLKLNQWCSVVRWEFKHAVPFLRGREFLWQEGHTAFATRKAAEEEVRDILRLYKRVYEELLAVPVIEGIKTEDEKFAGGDYTTSIETIVPSGKALQAATSHHLGQNFAKSFNIEFLNEAGEKEFAHQNSWGITTRSIGTMILMHGDDKGVVIPPKVSPLQVVIVPIMFDDTKAKVIAEAKRLGDDLRKHNVSIFVDERDNYTPGWKFNEWELKGVCLRVEIGPKDIDKNQVVVVRRDTGKKEFVKISDLSKFVPSELDRMQQDLLLKAKQFLADNIVDVKSWDELVQVIEKKKVARANFLPTKEFADKLKTDAGAKCLNMPFDNQKQGFCILTGKVTNHVGLFGRTY